LPSARIQTLCISIATLCTFSPIGYTFRYIH
jgi:hypothetical protein